LGFNFKTCGLNTNKNLVKRDNSTNENFIFGNFEPGSVNGDGGGQFCRVGLSFICFPPLNFFYYLGNLFKFKKNNGLPT